MISIRQKNVLMFLALTLIIAALAIAGCSSSDDPVVPEPPKDTTAPEVSEVVADEPDRLELVFSEAVDRTTAEDESNYTVDEPQIPPVSYYESQMKWQKPRPTPAAAVALVVTDATLLEDGLTVVLTTEGMDLFAPYQVAVANVKDLAGNVIVGAAKDVDNRIKSGRIFTIAGTGFPARGSEDIDPTLSDLYLPVDIVKGPSQLLYVLDWNNHRIRVIDSGLIRTILGTGLLGDALPGPALEVGLNHPTHVTFDPLGRLILGAWHNSKILRMDLTTNMVEVICAWSGARGYFGDGGPAYEAILNLPTGVQYDQQGRLLIADQANFRVRRVDTNDIITTVVGPADGTGTGCCAQARGYCGDGGLATEACMDGPTGQNAFPASKIEFDKDYNLYLCDTSNNVIRRVDGQTWIIDTVAGDGTEGSSGDGGAATSAQFDYPADVAIGPDGSFYVADTGNNRVRKIDTSGIITTVAGTGAPGFNGDGIRATDAELKEPFGVMVDAAGNLYISDTKNHRIRIVYK